MEDNKVVSLTVKDVKDIVISFIDWFAPGYDILEADMKLIEEEIQKRNIG